MSTPRSLTRFFCFLAFLGFASGARVVVFKSLLEACVTDTGAIDFGRSGATGLAKQVKRVVRRYGAATTVEGWGWGWGWGFAPLCSHRFFAPLRFQQQP